MEILGVLRPGQKPTPFEALKMKVPSGLCFVVLCCMASGQDVSFATGPPDTDTVFIGTAPPTLSPVKEPTMMETFQPTVRLPPAQVQHGVTPCQLCPSSYQVDQTASASVNDVLYPCESLPINLGQSPLCEIFRRRVESVCCVMSMTDGTKTTLAQDTSAGHPFWLYPMIEAAFVVAGLTNWF